MKVFRLVKNIMVSCQKSSRWPVHRLPLCFFVLPFLATTIVASPPKPQVEANPVVSEGVPKLVIDTQGLTSRVNSVDFNPRGDIVAAAGSDKVVRLWHTETGRLIHTIRGYDDDAGNGMCQVVVFSPDGKFLLVGVQDFGESGAIRVYDTADYSEIKALLPGHPTGGVLKLAFSADGRYLASGGADGGIILWNWPARKVVGQIAWNPNLAYFGFPSAVPMLVVYDSQGFHAFSALHARELSQLQPNEQKELAPLDQLQSAFLAAQKLGVNLGQIELKLPFQGRSLITRSYQAMGKAHEDFSVIGGSGKKDGRDTYWVGTWNGVGQQTRIYEGHTFVPSALAMTGDASLVASADSLGNVDLWETSTGRLKYRLSGKGQAIYNVAFDSTGSRVAFGTQSYGPEQWNYNNYGALTQSFDLRKRTLGQSPAKVQPAPGLKLGDRSVQLSQNPKERNFNFTIRKQGVVDAFYSLSPGVTPLSFGLLGTSNTGIENLLIVGCDDNGLFGLDPSNIIRGRKFIGHTGAINAFGESPDGRFLISGSADRTLRLWSLNRVNDMGWPDFDTYSNGVVYFLKPGGSSERAGVKMGDTFVKLGGRDLGTIFDRMMTGLRDYQPGTRSVIEMMRGGQTYQVEVDLVKAGDFVNPLLSLFIAGEEWVLWTPSGYYDASPGGDRLIGWHVNRGRAKAARYFTAHQFRKQFYRPDIIDKILETGETVQAIKVANEARPRAAESLDLRNPADFRKIEPPRVNVAAPHAGIHVNDRFVTVQAEVLSQNGEPIGDVKIILNGRPITGKTLSRGIGDTDIVRHVSLEVELEPGWNSVSVIATDQNSKTSSRPQEIIVHRDQRDSDVVAKPRAFVLSVGISNYAKPEYKLGFAHLDAQAFADAWEFQQGKLYSDVQSRILLNQNATVSAVREGLDWLNTNVGKNDYAILFISAHGVGDASEGYYIASYDVDPRRLISTAIPDRELISFSEGLRCRRTLVFLDTCHAGGIAGARPNSPESLRELTSDEVGAVMFGACKPRESSQEHSDWGHGAFTKALLETFVDPSKDLPPADGLLSIDELTFPLGRRVADLTGNQQHPVMNRPPTIENFDFFAFEPRPKVTGEPVKPPVRSIPSLPVTSPPSH